MKKVILVLLITGAAHTIFAANSGSASIIYSFMDIAPNARTAALADAVCGQSGDAGAIFINPASITGIKSPILSLTYGKWLVDSSYQNIMAVSKFDFAYLGAQVIYLNTGSFERRNDQGFLTGGSVNSYNLALSVFYGKDFYKNLSAGGALKIIGQSAGATGQAGIAADFGGQYKLDKISFGVSINNLGGESKYGYPTAFRGGIASLANIAKDNTINMGLDVKYIINDDMLFSLGAEYSYMDIVFVRSGYRMRTGSNASDIISGFTFGAGFKYAGIIFDYALVPYGELGLTHRATFSYAFGNTDEHKVEYKKIKKDKQGMVPELMEYYKAVNKDRKNITAWKKLARAYYMIGNISYALTTVEEGLKVAPKDKELLQMKTTYKKLLGSGLDIGAGK